MWATRSRNVPKLDHNAAFDASVKVLGAIRPVLFSSPITCCPVRRPMELFELRQTFARFEAAIELQVRALSSWTDLVLPHHVGAKL